MLFTGGHERNAHFSSSQGFLGHLHQTIQLFSKLLDEIENLKGFHIALELAPRRLLRFDLLIHANCAGILDMMRLSRPLPVVLNVNIVLKANTR